MEIIIATSDDKKDWMLVVNIELQQQCESKLLSIHRKSTKHSDYEHHNYKWTNFKLLEILEQWHNAINMSFIYNKWSQDIYSNYDTMSTIIVNFLVMLDLDTTSMPIVLNASLLNVESVESHAMINDNVWKVKIEIN